MPIPLFDLSMAAVLAVIVTSISRIRSPLWKSFVYSCPIPFTLAFLVSGSPMDSGHVAGVVLNNAFLWFMWLLHSRMKWPALIADVVAASTYVAFTAWLVRQLPDGDPVLYAALLLPGIGFSVLAFRLPDIQEVGAVSPMPVWQKSLLVFAIAVTLFSLKNFLLAAMTTFPYLGIFTVYECRRSLYTLLRRFGMLSLGFYAMLVTVRLVQGAFPAGPPWLALLAGWVPALLVIGWLQFRAASGNLQVEAA